MEKRKVHTLVSEVEWDFSSFIDIDTFIDSLEADKENGATHVYISKPWDGADEVEICAFIESVESDEDFNKRMERDKLSAEMAMKQTEIREQRQMYELMRKYNIQSIK